MSFSSGRCLTVDKSFAVYSQLEMIMYLSKKIFLSSVNELMDFGASRLNQLVTRPLSVVGNRQHLVA